ncbi:unnamed protein product [Calypogeia fissa]
MIFKMGWASCDLCEVQFYRPSNATQPNCMTCREVELESKTDMLQLTMNFLRYQFDGNEQVVDDILKWDTVIVVQGRRDKPLYAHKFILSSKSPVFCKMFNAKMMEGETGIVFIDDASQDVVRAVIKFCYDAQVDFTEVSADEVLHVAHKYDIALLQKVCEDHLATTIDCENLPKRLKTAKKFESKHLKAAVSQFFKKNFDEALPHVMEELC